MEDTIGTAVVTGADGGMGSQISLEMAAAGYHLVMLCYDKQSGEARKDLITNATGNRRIDVYQVDLSSMPSIVEVTKRLRADLKGIDLLMNNAGTMCTHRQNTQEGFERTVAVNYLAPFLLCNRLLPLMKRGSRIVNMVSCTYAIGRVGDHFFTQGSECSTFWRIPIYSNTKYALWMFTYELSQRLKDQGITVNAADPGVVSTAIIHMDMWFDPLTDIFFRPFIRTPRQGADTAIHLLLDRDKAGITGQMYASGKLRKVAAQYTDRTRSSKLWADTEEQLKAFLIE